MASRIAAASQLRFRADPSGATHQRLLTYRRPGSVGPRVTAGSYTVTGMLPNASPLWDHAGAARAGSGRSMASTVTSPLRP
jgi:hypothetical protein